MRNNLYIVIVGCGRLGSYLANHLSRIGNSIVVIDINESTFNNLSSDFSGFKIHGDATQIAMLREAKADKADIFFATTHEDNVNLMVAQVAQKVFNVPKVLARVYDPKREEVYAHLHIDTICPTSMAAEMFLKAVENGYLNMDGEKS
ncbi:MAG: TrkA family potassium uptake protein [Deltaproteobacteria bacterium]|nr:TrkA family potassium uptake protein [Deltaproteobacteria bacterium]